MKNLYAVVVADGGNICFDVPGGLCVYTTKKQANIICKEMKQQEEAARGEKLKKNPWKVQKYIPDVK